MHFWQLCSVVSMASLAAVLARYTVVSMASLAAVLARYTDS